MTVQAYGVINGDGLVQFTKEPTEDGNAEVILTVSKDSLEYFGLEGEFKLQSRR